MQVHYWELSNYNAGKLIGRWFDLDGMTKDEHMAEVAEWLEELTDETGELCEEIILGDVDDIPSGLYWEHGLDDDIWEYIEAIDEHDKEIVDAAIACDIPLDKIDDAYSGHFESDEDFAWEYIESTGMLDGVPDSLQNYFDIESFACDLTMDYAEDNGHYFLLSY